MGDSSGERRTLRRRLDRNRDALLHSLERTPEDVDGRDLLWRERYRLLTELEDT